MNKKKIPGDWFTFFATQLFAGFITYLICDCLNGVCVDKIIAAVGIFVYFTLSFLMVILDFISQIIQYINSSDSKSL